MMPRVMRAVAVLIVILAIIDPTITVTRPSMPRVAVIAATPEDSAPSRRVARQLADDYEVVNGSFGAASATVLIGHSLPSLVDEYAAPFFAVLPDPVAGVTIEYVDVPARAPLHARVPVHIGLRLSGADSVTVDVMLRAGSVLAQHVMVPVAGDEPIDVPMSFVPADTGVVTLRVSASIEGSGATAADAVVDVDAARYRLLFHDPRPSWMSTFVRRAVERDPRFLVASRTITAPGLSIDVGQPPALADRAALHEMDAIVIGAPDALSDRDVTLLERFMRERGGRVILLMDRRAAGPHDRLLAVRSWQDATHDGGVALDAAASDTSALRASELRWPAQLAPNARNVAYTRDAARAAPVWETAVGAGGLLVSGALDAWRFRDPSLSGFDAFWQETLAEAASLAPASLEVRLERNVLRPGGRIELSATIRDIALRPLPAGAAAEATISAAIEPGIDSVTLWPGELPGSVTGALRAPNEPGLYRVVVSNGETRAGVPLLVSREAGSRAPDLPGLVSMWAGSHGGRVLHEADVDSLPALLRASLGTELRRVPWRPMRSPWWIVPFALALGIEWWIRRRRGLS